MVRLFTVLQPLPLPPGMQSPNEPPDCSTPFVSPPEPTQLKTRMLVAAPPLVNVPRSRMSPTVCKPLNVPSGFVLTGLLKNQKPMSFDPFTAVRSAPKKRNSWPPTAGSTYFAANPSVMSSASGTEELVCLQLLMSRSSFEPPVVKTLCPSGSWIQSH